MKGEEKKLKKYLMIPLFSTLFFTNGMIAFADEETPMVPLISEETEVPIPVPGVPDTGEERPTVPVDPGTSETKIPDTSEVPVTPPIELSGDGEKVPIPSIDSGAASTETTGTTETSDSSMNSSTVEQPTTPSISEKPEQPTEERPIEKPNEDKETKPNKDKLTGPAKEMNVSIDSSGKITTDAAQGASVPIVTSNIKEISHVPTPTTPLRTATGQTIVGVKDGVPLIQDAQGNLVEDPSIPVKKLPSGNIEVKTADGKTKVLPKTGEEIHAVFSVLGMILTSIAGFFGYKRKRI
ncbi:LPXTG cell wall anchor domain-containing protein [Enterococcus hirae]